MLQILLLLLVFIIHLILLLTVSTVHQASQFLASLQSESSVVVYQQCFGTVFF
jgi:hypothetical protein